MKKRLSKVLSILLICALITSEGAFCVFGDELSDNSISDNELSVNEVISENDSEDDCWDDEISENLVSENLISEDEISENLVLEKVISSNEVSENTVSDNEVSENELSENSVSMDVVEISSQGMEAFEKIVKEYPVEALIYHGDFYSIKREADVSANDVYKAQSGEAVKLLLPKLDINGVLWYKVSLISDPDVTGYVERYYFATQDERLLSWEENYIDNEIKVVDEVSREGVLQEVTSGDGQNNTVVFSDNEDLTIEALGTDDTDILAFPESYREYLRGIKKVYPKWKFVVYKTGVDWSTAVDNEMKNNRSWIEKSASSEYVDSGSPKGGSWYLATKKGVSHYMDPRNALDASHIFMFEYLSYNSKYQTQDNVQSMLNSTFMKGKLSDGSSKSSYTYAKTFFEIGKSLKVNPLYLAARVLQEQGSGTSGMISGTYSSYKGYYNFFNIQAIGTGDNAVKTGLSYAKSRGWDTKYKSIEGGSKYISSGYITQGQDTVYLQKWDFVDTPYTHQYMQNIRAPFSESEKLYSSYNSTGIISNAQFMFKIPTFDNMTDAPDTAKKTSIKKCKITGIKDVTIKAGKTGPFTIKGYKLKCSGKTLKEGIDYIVSYKSNTKAGKGKITFKGIGESYEGAVTKTFKIKACPITNGKIKVLTTTGSKKLSMPYVKGGSKINVVIKAGNVTLNKGVDYKIKYTGYNANAGKKGKIKITGIGRYSGTKVLTYSITKSNLNNTVVTVTSPVYVSGPGNYIPTVSIEDSNGKALVPETDYSTSYVYTYVNDTTVRVDGVSQLKTAGSIAGINDEVPIDTQMCITITPKNNYGTTPVGYRYNI